MFKVGDIPDEDIAPPENVLFVCKLNPVTTDEDLEVIFSRFGNIKRYDILFLIPWWFMKQIGSMAQLLVALRMIWTGDFHLTGIWGFKRISFFS